MSEIVVFDTSILVDQFRFGRHTARIGSMSGLVRSSAVVLAELLRGATTAAERRVVEAIRRNHPVLTPTENNWVESGELLAKLRAASGFAASKLRDLHFDVLIALTVRSHGARLVTSNRADFELIRRYRKFGLEIW